MLIDQFKINELSKNIISIKKNVDILSELGNGINCIEKNIERMQACIKIMELHVCDVAELMTEVSETDNQ